MHEATIAANILDAVSLRLRQFPNTIATSVNVLIGEFRNVDAESLMFAFDALRDSVRGCEFCELIVEASPLVALCAEHKHRYFPKPDGAFKCQCGSGMGEVIHGSELDIVGYALQAMPVAEEEKLCTK